MAALLKSGRQGIAGLVEKAVGSEVDVEALAAILLACFDGLALQRLVDPEFDSAPAYKLLSRLTELLQSEP